MSSAYGEAWTLEGERIGIGCYHGTSDVFLPGLVKTWDEDFWNNPGGWKRLEACEHEGEPVRIYSDYGGGTWWEGTACRECMVVKGPLSPYPEDFGYSRAPEDYVAPVEHKGHPFPELKAAEIELENRDEPRDEKDSDR